MLNKGKRVKTIDMSTRKTRDMTTRKPNKRRKFSFLQQSNRNLKNQVCTGPARKNN
jgi:hypothetical protein